MIDLMLALALAAAKDKPKPPPAPAPVVASVDGLPIGSLSKQDLPATGCAAYLWTLTPSHALVAMATADPATVRLTLDGVTADYAKSAADGAGGYGFANTTEYKGGDVTATLDMAIVTRPDLAGGAAVPEATLRVERPGRDALVLPVAGLIGCAA